MENRRVGMLAALAGLIPQDLGQTLGMSMHDMLLRLTMRRKQQVFGPGQRDTHKRIDRRAYRMALLPSPITPNSSRQALRQAHRAEAKSDISAAKRTERTFAGRDLLSRQRDREKSGFYASRSSVENALAHRRAGRLQRQLDDEGKLVRLA